MSNATPRRVPAFLASVTSTQEAYTAFAAGADVIDCKDPATGALGRLDPVEIARIVEAVAALAPVSATIGDSFASAQDRVLAAEEVAATGVAIVKCGFEGSSDDAAAAEALASAKLGKAKLFAVLMADKVADFALVPHLARLGFMGVMLDTAGKAQGALPQIIEADRLRAFLSIARGYGLATGLAGSLRLSDIAPLCALGPDIVGFRGALCEGGRAGAVDEARVAAVRREIDRVAELGREKSVA
ncbi:MAG TPA: (5-formylfuran-3-yl)methyl phosphate synthase [Hyphomicrobium sp.]|nr:(5-formylfuran-3-yl)methyl phosphate synthase [Hyphomicrobium sp.]